MNDNTDWIDTEGGLIEKTGFIRQATADLIRTGYGDGISMGTEG